MTNIFMLEGTPRAARWAHSRLVQLLGLLGRTDGKAKRTHSRSAPSKPAEKPLQNGELAPARGLRPDASSASKPGEEGGPHALVSF